MAPSGAPVRARIVEGALRAVGQAFSALEQPDPRLLPSGKLDLRLSRQLTAYKKEDPPRELPKAWIAVATQPVLKELAAQLASQLGHADAQGFRVTRIYPGTNAAGSDLRTGDVIVALNGEKIAPRTLQDAGLFNRRVRQLTSEGDAILSVLRGSEKLDIKVPLERTRIGPEEALRDQNKDFDISVRELTFFDRDDMRIDDDAKGVLVENTERAGWAGLAGVFPGDLLQKVGDAEITDIPSWRKAMTDIAKRQPEKVTFVVLRGTRTFFLFAEPDWKPQTEAQAKEAEEKKRLAQKKREEIMR